MAGVQAASRKRLLVCFFCFCRLSVDWSQLELLRSTLGGAVSANLCLSGAKPVIVAGCSDSFFSVLVWGTICPLLYVWEFNKLILVEVSRPFWSICCVFSMAVVFCTNDQPAQVILWSRSPPQLSRYVSKFNKWLQQFKSYLLWTVADPESCEKIICVSAVW